MQCGTGQALRLLAFGLPPEQASREGQSLAKLSARLGEWAQLLKIVNGFLRDRVVNGRQSMSEAIAGGQQSGSTSKDSSPSN